MADPGTFTALPIAVTALVTAAAGLPIIPWRLRATTGQKGSFSPRSRCSRVRVAAQRQHACTQRRRCRPVQRERLGVRVTREAAMPLPTVDVITSAGFSASTACNPGYSTKMAPSGRGGFLDRGAPTQDER